MKVMGRSTTLRNNRHDNTYTYAYYITVIIDVNFLNTIINILI